MDKGKLFVLEGASDGIGKTTQFNLLNKYLIDNGYEVVNHHFPSYDTYHGAPVEKYLSGEFGSPEETSPYFVNGLYAMDRGCAWYSKLKPMYDMGKIICLDRYTTSSLIYQSALIDNLEEKKKFIDYVIDFEYNKVGIKKPDTVIFLYAAFDLVTELRNSRISNDGIVNDIHERDLEFMRKVYDSAMFVAKYLSWDMIKCDDGNKIRSIEDIHEDICCLVRKKIK